MGKTLRISIIILLTITAVLTLFTWLGIMPMPSFLNQFRKVRISDLPKNVPVVSGDIVSTRATRSDDFTRGVTVVVKTNLSLKEVVQYYNDEFKKRDISSGMSPVFQGNAREIESSTEAYAIGETKNHLGIVVSIKSEKQASIVTIQIKGNSVLFLPR